MGKRTSVYLDDDLDAALKASGRGIADILREVLNPPPITLLAQKIRRQRHEAWLKACEMASAVGDRDFTQDEEVALDSILQRIDRLDDMLRACRNEPMVRPIKPTAGGHTSVTGVTGARKIFTEAMQLAELVDDEQHRSSPSWG